MFRCSGVSDADTRAWAKLSVNSLSLGHSLVTGCSFVDKARRAQDAGAKAVIVVFEACRLASFPHDVTEQNSNLVCHTDWELGIDV